MNTGEMRYILERELSCPVRFGWSAAETVVTLKNSGVEINLRMAKDGEGFLRFLARYAKAAVFLKKNAETAVPESWLHGLALRDAGADTLKLGLLDAKMPKRRTWFTPAALWCYCCASEDTETVSLLEELPEVGWYGGKYPESSLAHLLRTQDADALVGKAAEAVEPFSVGLCLRLCAIGAMDIEALSPEKKAAVMHAADGFCQSAAQLSQINPCGMLYPYMAAAQDMAAKMNRWFSAETLRAGAVVYPMGDCWRIR